MPETGRQGLEWLRWLGADAPACAQVVTLALYTYFVAALMGRQLVPAAPGSTSKYEPDVYFPLFTALQVHPQLCPIVVIALLKSSYDFLIHQTMYV